LFKQRSSNDPVLQRHKTEFAKNLEYLFVKGSVASAGKGFVFAALAMAGVTALLLVCDAAYRDTQRSGKDAALFQNLVGGLGLGAAASPAWNLFYYDQRLQSVDDSNLWPIPGSYPYSPTAASAVVVFREHPREDLRLIRVEK
jgi:hypothetical protein